MNATPHTDGLARLRALLYASPSPQGWTAICDTFSRWPQRDPIDIGVDYAETHLQSWPDELRRAPRRLSDALVEALKNPDIFAFPRTPLWRLIRVLSLTRYRLGNNDAASLNQWGQLPALRSLDLSHNLIKHEGLASIVAHERLEALQHLKLRDNPLGDNGARSLDGAFPSLRSLDLRQTRLEDNGLFVLARSPIRRSLKTLDLSENNFTEVAGRILTRWPQLATLSELRLSTNALTDDGLGHLLTSPHLEGLEQLNLDSNHIGDQGLVALFTHERLRALQHLSLRNAPLNRALSKALADSPLWRRLASLTLDYSSLHDHGAILIAAAAQEATLNTLSLQATGLSARGVEALMRAPWPQLRNLTLTSNSAAAGLSSLASNPNLHTLRQLHLAHTGLNDRSLTALTNATPLGQLQTLNLSHNRLTLRGMRALSEATFTQSLTSLLLAHNKLEDAGVATLFDLGHFPRLRHLDLTRTQTGAEGLNALSRAFQDGRLPQLSTLRVDHKLLHQRFLDVMRGVEISGP